MVLANFGKFLSEYDLSRIVHFDPDKGVSPKMMSSICEIINFECEYLFKSNFSVLKNILENKNYPIVLINPGLLYDSIRTKHNHYITIKNITNENVIFNDPDQEYGGENKCIQITKFLESWESSYNFVFVVRGEMK